MFFIMNLILFMIVLLPETVHQKKFFEIDNFFFIGTLDEILNFTNIKKIYFDDHLYKNSYQILPYITPLNGLGKN